MNNAIIIFQKNPEPGKVKTRLASTIGNHNALKIYTVLVEHTHDVVSPLEVEKYLFFSNFIESDEKWEKYKKNVQRGDDLGVRMFNAIQFVKSQGAERIVVLGTDCYELTTVHLEQAFTALETNDYCIGPARDGGYYLIGTTNPDPEVFLEKEWSTETVFEEAKSSIVQVNKSLYVLQTLSDVDYEEDLKSLAQFLT